MATKFYRTGYKAGSPTILGERHDTASVGANTDYFSSDLRRTNPNSKVQVLVILDTGGVISIIDRVGGNTIKLNGGLPVIGDSPYIEEVLLPSTFGAFNIQSDTASAVFAVVVLEIT